MRFRVLGSFEVHHDGHDCTPTAPKVRQVLALLSLRMGQVVSLDSMIEELWEGSPPRSAVTTTQTYIYQLRKILDSLGIEGERALYTRPPGYTLSLSGESLDSLIFDRMLNEGTALHESGEAGRASQVLRDALGMWTGSALANMNCGTLLRGYAAHLEERRMAALELRILADMQLGRHRELIPELKALVAAHPLNEWLHAQLISLLYTAGRRGEALQAYQEVRRVLNIELGLEPSAELQRIQQDILGADDRAAASPRPAVAMRVN